MSIKNKEFEPLTFKNIRKGANVVFNTTYNGLIETAPVKIAVGKIISGWIPRSETELDAVLVEWENGWRFNYDPKALLIEVKRNELEGNNPNTAFRRSAK